MINLSLSGPNLSPKKLIQSAFSSPLIGSTCSQAAEELCLKNNLNFVSLIQPFSKISTEAHFRDPSGVSVSIRGLSLNICDVDYRPPQTLLARKMLNESVSMNTVNDEKIQIPLINKPSVEIPATNPWFEEWREIFFMVQFPSDHEFTRHLIACLIVVASSDPSPVEQAQQLTKKVKMMQNISPPKLPKWISASSDEALNCYLMLHDGSTGDISKAQQGFENLKATFGENRCFLVQINSQSDQTNTNQLPDVWSKFVKNYHKTEFTSENNPESVPKTPQDITQMPTTIQMSQLGTMTPPNASSNQSGSPPEIIVNHPLSPLQENLPDISQVSSQVTLTMSSSTNSLSDQPTNINPNVWLNEPTDVNVPHGSWLTTSDLDNLRHFVQDFTIRALIPYVEKVVGQLNESLTNKKSVSKSLLGATKRWFNTNKPGLAPTTAVIYTAESSELQTRKLGDLYFMFRNYNLAFQAYHQAKRDFYSDSAWLFYAGALEMAALSAFMHGTANRKTYDYMEEAIMTYLNVCKLPQFATRATLLSVECLKAGNLHCEAAKQLTRMTSEDADLRSALLLEQAAYCYLTAQPSFYRKYAFHSVLSGHRYTKAGQRKHAFRMYKQAEQVISNKGWNLAEDHIQYTISKQAIMLKKLEEAVECLSHLLRPTSLQSVQQQAGFLREYIATQKTLMAQTTSDELLTIALPHLNQNSVRVLVTSVSSTMKDDNLIPASNIDIMSGLTDTWMWNKLEDIVAQTAARKPFMVFKPQRSLYSGDSPTNEHPLCVLGEPIHVAFVLENPIKPSILFENITLLWEFKKDSGELFSNRNFFTNGGEFETFSSPSLLTDKDNKIHHRSSEYSAEESVIVCTVIDAVEFGEYEKKTIHMKISSKFVGYLRIVGVAGKVSSIIDKVRIWGKLNFEKIPIKLEANNQVKSDYDRKLEIQILPPTSALQVRFSDVPKEVLAGEVFPVTMEVNNTGLNDINDLFIATNSPKEMILEPKTIVDLPLSIEKDLRDISQETFNKDKEFRRQYVTKILDNQQIKAGETRKISAFIQAPHRKGRKSVKILIYYNVPDNYPKIKYRLIRHEITMNVNDCLSIEGNCNIANEKTGEVGLDITLKNINQTHHLFSIDISIGDLYLFSRKFSLNQKKIYYINNLTTSTSISNFELSPNESLNIRCILDEKEKEEIRTTFSTFWDRLKANLSSFCVKAINELTSDVLKMNFGSNFLIRNEAKYFPFTQQNITNEDMSKVINANNKHMALCINWKASVSDNGKTIRMAIGQHFVQIDQLFESYFCPIRRDISTFNVNTESYGIYEYQKYLDKHARFTMDDDWVENKSTMSFRCFLESDAH
ncbi:CLUMA_CG015335, isoform A [Clunio marinus]|uniref:CLUMA_CG015335, isoform A n=1 Tax=Clunio marinus TaxID=568069 RepID=A0A1J1IPI9_9DIPT|nr:CLUMA_CG015335, isoform A [Clunio marinus]